MDNVSIIIENIMLTKNVEMISNEEGDLIKAIENATCISDINIDEQELDILYSIKRRIDSNKTAKSIIENICNNIKNVTAIKKCGEILC